MTIYVLLAVSIATLWTFFSVGRLSKRLFLIVSFTFMAIVLGCRGPLVGEDTSGYLEIASISKSMNWRQIFSSFPLSTFANDPYGYPRQTETVYLAFNKLIMLITNNSQLVLMICAAVTCFFFGRYIYDDSRDVGESTWLFLCESLFMFGFNGMRQLMAMSLAVQFYSCFKRGRYVRGFVWIAVAAIFHTSCIFFFVVAVLYIISRSGKAYRIAAVCCLLWPLVYSAISTAVAAFFPRYALYTQVSYWQSSLGGFAILLAILVAAILFFGFQRHKNQDDRFLHSCAPLYIALELVAQRYSTLSRVALVPRAFLLFFYPCVLARIKSPGIRTLAFMALNGAVFLLFLATASSPARLYVPFWV